MKTAARLLLPLLIALLPAARAAEKGGFKYPPVFEGARTEVYKTVGDVKLSLSIFEPATRRVGVFMVKDGRRRVFRRCP